MSHVITCIEFVHSGPFAPTLDLVHKFNGIQQHVVLTRISSGYYRWQGSLPFDKIPGRTGNNMSFELSQRPGAVIDLYCFGECADNKGYNYVKDVETDTYIKSRDEKCASALSLLGRYVGRDVHFQ